jgi:hypothetical protein
MKLDVDTLFVIRVVNLPGSIENPCPEIAKLAAVFAESEH